jgi:hypothetical protein
MEPGLIASPQRRNGRWRGYQPGSAQRGGRSAVAAQRPASSLAVQDQVRRAVLKNHGAVGQGRRRCQVVQALATAVQSFGMQNPIDIDALGPAARSGVGKPA